MPKQEFEIRVVAEAYVSKWVTITADTYKEACELALSGDHDEDADWNINTVDSVSVDHNSTKSKDILEEDDE